MVNIVFIILLTSVAVFFYLVSLYFLSLEIENEEIKTEIKKMLSGYFNAISDISCIIWAPIFAAFYSLVLLVKLCAKGKIIKFASAFLKARSIKLKVFVYTSFLSILLSLAVFQLYHAYLIVLSLSIASLILIDFKKMQQVARGIIKRQ